MYPAASSDTADMASGLSEAEDKENQRMMFEERVQKRLAFDRKAREIVEMLLDNPITEGFLLDCALSINPQHYQDVVIERSIVKQCGYPLCHRSLTNVPKQKYHISSKTNRVYDITDRKCFCSQFCYKASKFFEAQLSDSPLWTREMERPLDFKLLTKDMEAQAAASSLISKDNVVLTERIEPQEIDKAGSSEKDMPLKEEAVGLLADDLSNLTFADTWRKERLQELAEISKPSTSHLEERRIGEQESLSKVAGVSFDPGKSGQQSKGIEEEDILIKQNGKVKPKENLDQGRREDSGDGAIAMDVDVSADLQQGGAKKKTKKKSKKSHPPEVKEVSLLEVVSKIVLEWTTDATLEFIFRSNQQPSSTQESMEQSSSHLESQSASLSASLIPEPLGTTSEPMAPPAKPLPGMHQLKEETEQYSLKVQEFYYGSHAEVKKKKETEAEKQDKTEKEAVDRTIRLPLVDSKSQMAIRRRILSERLNRVYSEILVPLRLSRRDISSDLQALIHTFQLSSTNISFRPAGWTLLGLLMLIILTKRNALIRDSITKDDNRRFLDSLLIQLGTSLEQLGHVVTNIELIKGQHPATTRPL